MSRQWEQMIIGLAWILPKRLVYWCAIRVMAHATTGKHSNQVVPDLLVMDALKRWEEQFTSSEK
jgi:hypothetical protein